MHLNKFAILFAGLMLVSPIAFAQEAAPEAPAAEAPAPAPAPAADPAPAAAPAPAVKAGAAVVKDKNDLAGATAVLAKCDENHNYFKDQQIRTDMVLNGGVHKNVKYSFDTYTRGLKRSVRFDEPAEMRGMGVVTKGRDEVYARLPDSSKVRRVGTHAKRQSFYGSDWSMDDMSMIYYGQDYDVVKILNLDDKGHYVFELKLKDGVDLPYPKPVIKIEKTPLLMAYIAYYDDTQSLKKTQERFDLKDIGSGHLVYSHIKVTDAATKHTTENFVLSEKINQNIPDETFTKRWLVRSM